MISLLLRLHFLGYIRIDFCYKLKQISFSFNKMLYHMPDVLMIYCPNEIDGNVNKTLNEFNKMSQMLCINILFSLGAIAP
jgi:hypothetical protein